MLRRSTTLSEFYQQLQIVLAAELALPEALAEIATGMTGKLQGVCEQMAADSHRGLDLMIAMDAHPAVFPKAHVAALAASTKTLPALVELSAEQGRFLAAIRKGLAYPLAMMIFNAGLLAGLMLTVVPMFAESALELGVQRSAVYEAAAHGGLWLVVLVLAGLALALHVWLVIPGRLNDKAVARLLQFLPGAGRVTRAHDYGLLSALWEALVRAGQHDAQLLQGVDDLMADRGLRKRVASWQADLERGRALFDVVVADSHLEARFRNDLDTSEQGRVQGLASAAERYRTEAQQRSTMVAGTWTLLSTNAMILWVAIVIIGLFRPLTQLLGVL